MSETTSSVTKGEEKISFRFTKEAISVDFLLEVILCRLKLTERMSETNACHMCKTFRLTHSHTLS